MARRAAAQRGTRSTLIAKGVVFVGNLLILSICLFAKILTKTRVFLNLNFLFCIERCIMSH